MGVGFGGEGKEVACTFDNKVGDDNTALRS